MLAMTNHVLSDVVTRYLIMFSCVILLKCRLIPDPGLPRLLMATHCAGWVFDFPQCSGKPERWH